jgi:hypothetical protein
LLLSLIFFLNWTFFCLSSCIFNLFFGLRFGFIYFIILFLLKGSPRTVGFPMFVTLNIVCSQALQTFFSFIQPSVTIAWHRSIPGLQETCYSLWSSVAGLLWSQLAGESSHKNPLRFLKQRFIDVASVPFHIVLHGCLAISFALLTVLESEPRVSCLLGRCFYHLSHGSSPFVALQIA